MNRGADAHGEEGPPPLIPLPQALKEDHEVVCPFPAFLMGRDMEGTLHQLSPIVVYAVLERTAVWSAYASSAKMLVKHSHLLVEADQIELRLNAKARSEQIARAKGVKLSHRTKSA